MYYIIFSHLKITTNKRKISSKRKLSKTLFAHFHIKAKNGKRYISSKSIVKKIYFNKSNRYK